MAEDEKSLSPEIIKLTEKMASDPSSRLFVLLAEEYMKSGMMDEAHMVLTEGLKIHPQYMGAHVSLGKLYWQQGKKQQAREEFEQVVDVNPDNVLAHRYLVQIYKDGGHVASALSSCRLILGMNPKDPEMRKVLEHLEISSSIQGEGEKASPVVGKVPHGEVDFPQSVGQIDQKMSSDEEGVVVQEKRLPDVNPDEDDPRKVQSLGGESMMEKDPPDIEIENFSSPFENPQEKGLAFNEENDIKEMAPDNQGTEIEPQVGEHTSEPLDEAGVETLKPEKETPSSTESKEEEAPERVSEELGTTQSADIQELRGERVLENSEANEETVIEISEESVEDLKSLEEAFSSQFVDSSEGENHQSSSEDGSFIQQKPSDVDHSKSDFPDVNEQADLSPRSDSPSEQTVQPNKKDEFETESLAELYIRQGYYDKGIEIYRVLIQGDPNKALLKQKLEDAVTLSSLLTGKDYGGFSSSDSSPIESDPEGEVKEEHSKLEPVLKPIPESKKDGEKTPNLDSKTAKVQRLQSWLENMKKGQRL